jgi:hypothetical protein
MPTTLERIKQYIDLKGISIRAFEITCGFSNGSFASQLKNNRTIGVDKLENILNNYPELNANWILLGKGKMLNHESSENPTIETSDTLNSELQELIATQKDLIKMQKDKIEDLERKLSEGKKGKEKAS